MKVYTAITIVGHPSDAGTFNVASTTMLRAQFNFIRRDEFNVCRKPAADDGLWNVLRHVFFSWATGSETELSLSQPE